MPSKIEWTEETWNPVTGCTKISPGCANCYAEKMARRLAGRYGYPEAPHHFDVTLHPDRLDQPLRWRKPRRVFVCSMGDLFHDDVPWSFRDRVFETMMNSSQHTYQVLTKRPEAACDYLTEIDGPNIDLRVTRWWPNVWLGVTAENQETADERIPVLLQTPAAVRFVSVEPMLGPVDLEMYFPEYDHRPTYSFYPDSFRGNGKSILVKPGIDWAIIGCESGPNRRPIPYKWALDLVHQCQFHDVPVFVKQLPLLPEHAAAGAPVSKNPDEWPEELRVREYPNQDQ